MRIDYFETLDDTPVTTRILFPLLLLPLCLMFTFPLAAMPPHPDLLAKIRNHEIQTPYYLDHYDDIRAQGVEAPTRCGTIDLLARRALDEDINMIVILVDFSDHTAHAATTDFDSLLFGQSTGTVHDYYEQISYGRLNLVTVNMPSTLGWRRAPQSYSYYVNGQNGFGSYPHNAQRLAEDAVHLADPFVNFAPYDNDGNGQVDALFIVHAGPGAELSGNDNDIWSHKWQMPNPVHTDGVTVSVYSMEPEYWQAAGDMTCGVYCHEMGHSVFGLPDLYDTDYSSEGLGDWSLMAGGSWNGPLGRSPSSPDAWSRIRMGFVNPINLTTNRPNEAIPAVESTPTIYRLWTDGAQSNEYFLVENRQRIGYDQWLPGGGLMIYHVDDSQPGNSNQWYPAYTDSGHYKVALLQSDNQWQLERNQNRGDVGDPYPGITANDHFTFASSPSCEGYNMADVHVSVRHISASEDTMHASLYVASAASNNPVFAQLPDTTDLAGDVICVPIQVENDLAGRNVTSLQAGIRFDSTVVSADNPCYDLSGCIVPLGWTVTATPTAGGISISASGTTPLSGHGSLLCFRLRAPVDEPDGRTSALQFAQLRFNQGTPATDMTNGRLTVIAPIMTVDPLSVNLGTVRAGTSHTYNALVIWDHGSAPLEVDSFHTPGFFTTDFHGPQTVAPGRWCPVHIQFSPESAQWFADTLKIYARALGSPMGVAVSGRGAVPELECSASILNFDTVGIGETADRTFTLSDSGYWPTQITAVEFSSGAHFAMHAMPQLPDSLPARGEKAYTVRFTSVVGEYTDTLTITNDAGEALRVVLQGVGMELGTEAQRTGIPTAFGVSPVYPNPFNPSASVSYDVPRSAWVKLAVYDVLGREVDLAVDGMQRPGRYSLTWSCPQCGSGLYFFVLTADGKRFAQKAMLLR